MQQQCSQGSFLLILPFVMDRFEKNVKQFFRNKRKNFRTVAQECELLLVEKTKFIRYGGIFMEKKFHSEKIFIPNAI